MNKPVIVHPILFSVYPIVFLYSKNLSVTEWIVITKPLTAVLCTTLLLWWLAGAILKNKMKAGLVISLGLLLFFSYGPFHELLLASKITFGRSRFLVPVWALIFLCGTYRIVISSRYMHTASHLLNLMGATLLALSMIEIGAWGFSRNAITNERVDLALIPTDEDGIRGLRSPNPSPDIYYIILDGYMRSDRQMEVLGHENYEFTNYLEDKGFYIASEAHSNYAYTLLSLASSLNMSHVTHLEDMIGSSSEEHSLVYPLIRNNEVGRILKSFGYKYVQIGGIAVESFNRTHIADETLIVKGREAEDRFLALLYETTVMFALTGEIIPRTWQWNLPAAREEVTYGFDQISQAGNKTQPVFVFAHIISPHSPYVFGSNGEIVNQPEGGWSTEDEKSAYLNQLVYINKQVMDVVDHLLSTSNTPPIIVLQSDHGWTFSGMGNPRRQADFDYERLPVSEVISTFSILSAYYLPGNKSKFLYGSITPANSFRLIFNSYFDGNYEMLRDESYYSNYYGSPFKFANVTEILNR